MRLLAVCIPTVLRTRERSARHRPVEVNDDQTQGPTATTESLLPDRLGGGRDRLGRRDTERLYQRQRRDRAREPELLPLPGYLRRDQHGDQQLQRAERRQVHDLVPDAAAGLRRAAAAAGAAAGRARPL